MQRVLLIEEAHLAATLRDLLDRRGIEVVGPAASLPEAIDLAAKEQLNGAVIDISTIDGHVDDVAAILARRGVPFMLFRPQGEMLPSRTFIDAMLVDRPANDSVLMRELRSLGQLQ